MLEAHAVDKVEHFFTSIAGIAQLNGRGLVWHSLPMCQRKRTGHRLKELAALRNQQKFLATSVASASTPYNRCFSGSCFLGCVIFHLGDKSTFLYEGVNQGFFQGLLLCLSCISGSELLKFLLACCFSDCLVVSPFLDTHTHTHALSLSLFLISFVSSSLDVSVSLRDTLCDCGSPVVPTSKPGCCNTQSSQTKSAHDQERALQLLCMYFFILYLHFIPLSIPSQKRALECL